MKHRYKGTEFFTCTDLELLKGISTTLFQTKTISGMKDRIDKFISNRDHLIFCEELNRKAIQSTYEDQNYTLD